MDCVHLISNAINFMSETKVTIRRARPFLEYACEEERSEEVEKLIVLKYLSMCPLWIGNKLGWGG